MNNGQRSCTAYCIEQCNLALGRAGTKLMLIYEKPSTITYEASIRSDLLKDYYITMSNIDRSEYYNIKFQKKPFMMWIWISVIFISLGGFLRFFKNAKKYY